MSACRPNPPKRVYCSLDEPATGPLLKAREDSNPPRPGILVPILAAFAIALAHESGAAGSFVTEARAAGRAPAAGMFLVATRALDDSHFGRTVVYLLDHGDEGTLGLIVNRPGDSSLSEAVPDLVEAGAAAHDLYYGGPVGLPVIMMLARGDGAAEGLAYVVDDVYVSTDRDAIEAALAAGKNASELRFYFGYSGWAGGQLEAEFERGSWHLVPADTDAVFSGDVEDLWQQLIEQLEPEGIQVYRWPLSPLPAIAA